MPGPDVPRDLGVADPTATMRPFRAASACASGVRVVERDDAAAAQNEIGGRDLRRRRLAGELHARGDKQHQHRGGDKEGEAGGGES